MKHDEDRALMKTQTKNTTLCVKLCKRRHLCTKAMAAHTLFETQEMPAKCSVQQQRRQITHGENLIQGMMIPMNYCVKKKKNQ